MISSHIVAKRFVEAEDQSALLDDAFRKEFHSIMSQEYERMSKLVSCQMVVSSSPDDPYDSYDAMHKDVLLNGTLVMKSYASTLGLHVDCKDYETFRLIHDLHHVLLNLQFDYESEYTAFNLFILGVKKRYNATDKVIGYIRNTVYYVSCMIEGYTIPDSKIVLDNLLYA